jgi:hypothetical protein
MKKIIFLTLLTLIIGQKSFGQDAETIKPSSKLAYVSQVSAGFLGGDESSIVFHVKNGVSFANHFYSTVGLGFERYYGTGYLPIFFDFRYNVLKRKTTPFVSIVSGYLQPLVTRSYYGKNKGGFTGGAKIGVSHFFSENLGLETSLGYRFSRVELANNYFYAWDSFYYPYTTEYNMNRFELSVGLIFK